MTISALATAGGTLALAVSTFGSVRSANRAARTAERSLLAGLRPLLLPSRPDDPIQKVPYSDDHWEKLPGGEAIARVTADAVYLAISLRNVADGIAVLHGWRLHAGWYEGGGERPPAVRVPPAHPRPVRRRPAIWATGTAPCATRRRGSSTRLPTRSAAVSG